MPTAITGLYKALLAVQKESPALQKDAINPHFRNRYIKLESLMEKILPVLQKHSLLLLQEPDNIEGEPALKTTIYHIPTGDSRESIMPLTLDKPTSQGQGSAITYARRYSLMSILGLVADEDDDGNAASGRSTRREAFRASDIEI